MGIHARIAGDPSLVSRRFSGKDERGVPLQGHGHCFIFPLDNDRDGRLDHLVVTCREAFDEQELLALLAFKELRHPDGRPPDKLVPIRCDRLDRVFEPASLVTSATPFVPPRHYRKGRGAYDKWLEAELLAELSRRGLPAPIRVERADRPLGGTSARSWGAFDRTRKGEPERAGFGFSLNFGRPVPVPFALGYGCHFGVGLFVGQDARSRVEGDA